MLNSTSEKLKIDNYGGKWFILWSPYSTGVTTFNIIDTLQLHTVIENITKNSWLHDRNTGRASGL